MDNNKKSLILSILLVIALGTLLTFSFLHEEKFEVPNYIYQVYLEGNKIGLIESKDELYKLINNEQAEIKNKYKVDQVYPPNGFQIIKTYTYDDELSSVEDVYSKIQDQKNFTVKGYTVTIKPTGEDSELIYIYVLDKQIFEDSLKRIVSIFVGEDRFNQYQNETQSEIVNTGYKIENMYFDDKITIKESFISANERIFTNSTDLTKYLLFGDNNEDREYTVVQGDTVESIAEANKLNVDELLVANQNIKSSDALLAIGQKLNVALINPVLTLIYEELVVEDLPSQFQTEYVDDPNQYMGIETVKQEGQDGINRTTYRTQFINGARNQGIKIIGQPIPIKTTQNKIIARGTKRNSTVTGNFVPTNSVWQWPTNVPYVITSGFGWRWGALHEGIDISGTGFGSPIYAALDGNVVAAGWGGMVGNLAGLNVVLQHDNGYYTVYAHMSKVYVSVGQRVARGQAIGGMGMTGAATGVHLHFGLYYGVPYNGGYTLNPMRLWN